ncbi:MAG: response regulator transcription factor [Oscillospiraceae bacterium]|nr:response regulator transcription factor [Oscillospiraceae bacterium]
MGKKILIIEDEKNIVDILNYNLCREGYTTMEAYDGNSGLELALKEAPDLILLDLMLPGMNGFDVCQAIRAAGLAMPVLMLTAREEEADKVLGLEAGADDYVTKPFSMRELLARVRTNLRRTEMLEAAEEAKAASGVLTFGTLSIDTEGCSVTKGGAPVDVTQREYELLKFLASQPGKVFSREALMEQVWNYDYVGDVRTVDVTVRRLREKIEDVPAEPRYIVTRRGVGYLFSGQ